MARQVINIGSSPNDGNGDSLRVAGGKINDMTQELYDGLGASGAIIQHDITTGSSPINISIDDLTGNDVYLITTGGTKDFEQIILDGTTGDDTKAGFKVKFIQVGGSIGYPTISWNGQGGFTKTGLRIGNNWIEFTYSGATHDFDITGSGPCVVEGQPSSDNQPGQNSHSEGSDTRATGQSAHAEGSLTQAIGNRSHAEGDTTLAEGDGAHTEGQGTIAGGPAAHAEGDSTVAIGNASHAEGSGTAANGDASHAEGLGCVAAGLYAHAEGSSTQANGVASHTSGIASSARSVIGLNAHGADFGGPGNRQICRLPIGVDTTDATPLALTFGGGVAADNNQIFVPDDGVVGFHGYVVAKTGSVDGAMWKFEGVAKRSGTITFIDTPTITPIAQDTSLSTADISITADDTNHSISVNAIGIAATTIKWLGRIETEELVT